jgi:hypothetical protein
MSIDWRAELGESINEYRAAAVISNDGNPNADPYAARQKIYAVCEAMLKAAEDANRIKANMAALKDRILYYSIDDEGHIEVFNDEAGARNDAEQAIEDCLDLDSGWSEGTEHIEYGIMITLGEAKQTNLRESEDSNFDYVCEYILDDLAAPGFE